MTGLLVSVKNKTEALQILDLGINIIDLKQPSKGALGALDIDVVADIVRTIHGTTLVSATIGDLPMDAEVVVKAIQRMATTKVDYIKIGIFPQGDLNATLSKLEALPPLNLSLIAVLFADSLPHLNMIQRLKKIGFKGVMLDTMNKKRGSLTHIMTLENIKNFIHQAKKESLLVGLAGSLSTQDISRLLTLTPDYLGFRGAVCFQQDRVATLDRQAIFKIQKKMGLF